MMRSVSPSIRTWCQKGARWLPAVAVLALTACDSDTPADPEQPSAQEMSRRAPLVEPVAGVRFDELADWHDNVCPILEHDWRDNDDLIPAYDAMSLRQFAAILVVTCPEERWDEIAEAMVLKGWGEQAAHDLVSDMVAAVRSNP